MLMGGVPGHLGKWVLKLSDLQSRDSGRYTCRVHNQAGSINFTYTVEVVGKSEQRRLVLKIVAFVLFCEKNVFILYEMPN